MYSLIIIDDDDMIRKGMEKVVDWKKLGFNVVATFQSPVSALSWLRGNRADVLLTDIKMPGMSGLELIEEARAIHPDLKAVIMSGYEEFTFAKKALILKAEDYLLKPISESDIEQAFSKIRRSLDISLDSHSLQDTDELRSEFILIKGYKKDLIRLLEQGHAAAAEEVIQSIADAVSPCSEASAGYYYSYIVRDLASYFSVSLNRSDLFFLNGKKKRFESQTSDHLTKAFLDDMALLKRTIWENTAKTRELIVQKVNNIISLEYPDSSLSLAVIANRLDISYGYLSTVFSSTTGTSFKSQLVKVRMEQARKLLLQREYRIWEIAEKTGYKNPRYFTEAFRKYYGCSPAEYLGNMRGDSSHENL